MRKIMKNILSKRYQKFDKKCQGVAYIFKMKSKKLIKMSNNQILSKLNQKNS